MTAEYQESSSLAHVLERFLLLGGTLDEKKTTAFICKCKSAAVASNRLPTISLVIPAKAHVQLHFSYSR